MGQKNLTIITTFGCGHQVITEYTTLKVLEQEWKRLSKGDPIYDGYKYTKDYTIKRVANFK